MAIIPEIVYRLSPLTYFFLALIVIWLLVSMGQRCRSIRRAGLAGELNLQLFSRDPLGLPQRYEQMYLFRQGHARRARNVMIGHHQGRQLRLFDYLYETGLGQDRRTQQFSVVIMQVSRDLPGLLVQLRAPGRRQYNLSGMDQIKLPGITDQQGYTVFCERAGFTQDYISEEMLQNLRQCEQTSLEVQDGVLALYTPGKLKAGKYRQLRGLANELAEHLAGDNPQTDRS